MENLIWIVLAATLGGGIGYVIRRFQAQKQTQSAEAQARRLIDEAKTKRKEILLEAKDQALKVKEQAKSEERERRDQIARLEQRLEKREENLDSRIEALERRQQGLAKKEREFEEIKSELKEIRKEQRVKLEKIARLSRTEAKKVLLKLTEKEMKEELVRKIKEMEKIVKEEADKKAREIIGTAIQRYAAPHTAESTVSTVSIPSDEMKGRIIGREGRNIHAFEKATGVDVIVDDTPEAVVISGFDPIRRQVAKLALEKLILDGRIHPARIEEAVSEVKKKVGQAVKEAGEQAVYEVGVAFPDDLVKLLGRLKFRTSYGQNVLKHSIEVAFIASMLASEIGADVNICKKAGLLHDIGKAVDHEISGSHTAIGRDIAKKFGLSPEIIHAMEAHHEEVPFKTVEAIIIQAADAISGARPGARRETLEAYVKRLEELENIANAFPGVEKSFAIQAGREVRIIVKPEEIDDLQAIKLAKNIATKIEKDLNYPGQIKVNVIRETRAVDYAK
jgi:ribonuclease Y